MITFKPISMKNKFDYYQKGYTLRSNSFTVIEKYYPMPADEAALNPNIK